ncbi:d-isomer specific 2-hydroxyacid dehydrogenases signature 3 [Lucifera butyrica]|uniref:Glyoxylate/hydroxypyruvate reductase B n=1 Tax=Lucifera butyrica TaxID=1351585 RepID=A0A498R542_9FIRM|nr:D-glycerate dehydrogenase [Lucifera butyrica]VBB05382.1 d-isomer specific 2-hydroxyacid dehydrogenases signature 3 [Lucifera butyrica]
MDKYPIVMVRNLLAPAQNRLLEYCNIKLWEKAEPISHDILAKWLEDAEGLVAAGNVRIDERLLAYAPKLKVIAQSAVGYDNIDVDACTRRGIPVGNTPGVLVEATADLAFGLLLCATRRIHEGWEFVRQGKWTPNQNIPFGIDLYGKVLGIVGMGRIGAAVARRARAFGMRVIYYNRNRRPDEAELGVKYASFDNLLTQADCILVLTPLSPATRGLFGWEQFGRMKSTAFFVNAARGPIVDTGALASALAANQIAYAVLDVTDPEPLPGDHPLLQLPNVLVTPHIGSATIETRTRMALLTADNLLAGLRNRPLPACVNPEVNYK